MGPLHQLAQDQHGRQHKDRRGQPLHPPTARAHRLCELFERADVAEAHLERDERPKIETGERRILSEAEMAALLASADGFRTLVAVGLFAGLRIGESPGLVWDDVDFERGFLHVRYQLDRKRQRVPLKTAESRRDVVLVPQLAKVLREHRMASRFKAPGDFVFPAPDGRAGEIIEARHAESNGPSSAPSSATGSRLKSSGTRSPACSSSG